MGGGGVSKLKATSVTLFLVSSSSFARFGSETQGGTFSPPEISTGVVRSDLPG